MNIKEFYLEFHDQAANSHKWYAGLGVGDKYVTAHGRIDGFGRAGSLSIANVSHSAMGWKKLESVEKRKLKSGYRVSGNPLNSIPNSYRDVMATKLGVQVPLPSPANLPAPKSTPIAKPIFGMVNLNPTPPSPLPPSVSPVTAMTALSFDKHGSKIKFPAVVQRKLDGVRCLSWTDAKGDVVMMSRRNLFISM